MNMILPKKIVKIYPNEKPWMTKEVRLLLKAKKQAFQSGDFFFFFFFDLKLALHGRSIISLCEHCRLTQW